jgi:hypothetical protein
MLGAGDNENNSAKINEEIQAYPGNKLLNLSLIKVNVRDIRLMWPNDPKLSHADGRAAPQSR